MELDEKMWTAFLICTTAIEVFHTRDENHDDISEHKAFFISLLKYSAIMIKVCYAAI